MDEIKKAGPKKPVGDHSKCHHKGGGLYRKSPDGNTNTNRRRKLKRKQDFLRQMIERGANKHQVVSKAIFMGMRTEDFVHLLREVKKDEESSGLEEATQ